MYENIFSHVSNDVSSAASEPTKGGGRGNVIPLTQSNQRIQYIHIIIGNKWSYEEEESSCVIEARSFSEAARIFKKYNSMR